MRRLGTAMVAVGFVLGGCASAPQTGRGYWKQAPNESGGSVVSAAVEDRGCPHGFEVRPQDGGPIVPIQAGQGSYDRVERGATAFVAEAVRGGGLAVRRTGEGAETLWSIRATDVVSAKLAVQRDAVGILYTTSDGALGFARFDLAHREPSIPAIRLDAAIEATSADAPRIDGLVVADGVYWAAVGRGGRVGVIGVRPNGAHTDVVPIADGPNGSAGVELAVAGRRAMLRYRVRANPPVQYAVACLPGRSQPRAVGTSLDVPNAGARAPTPPPTSKDHRARDNVGLPSGSFAPPPR